jgi:hypothetical protein
MVRENRIAEPECCLIQVSAFERDSVLVYTGCHQNATDQKLKPIKAGKHCFSPHEQKRQKEQ